MTLHDDWVTAKKTSLRLYQKAVEEKRAALEKAAAKKDKGARLELVQKKIVQDLREQGVDAGISDVDDYFSFNEGFGPNLDKYEKTREAQRRALAEGRDRYAKFDQIMKNAKVLAAFKKYADDSFNAENYAFLVAGYKLEPMKAYKTFIDDKAELQLNIPSKMRQEFDELAKKPAQFKKDGPALLIRCRNFVKESLDTEVLPQFVKSPHLAAVFADPAIAPLERKVMVIADSYRNQIVRKEPVWKGVKSDFRKPLLDTIAAIKSAL